MDSIGHVFLGVIAAASLLQAAVLVGVLMGACRLARSAIGDATERVRRTGDVVERVVRQTAGAFAAALAFTGARRFLARRAARAGSAPEVA